MPKTEEKAAAARSWKRWILLAVSILIVGAVFLLFFWPAVQVDLWLGELHSDDGRVRAEAADDLASSTYEGLDGKLEAAFLDPSVSYWVRTRIGSILVRRNRLTIVEDAMHAEALTIRAAALAVLHAQASKLGQEWFDNDVARNPSYEVEATVLAWLGTKGDPSRAKAIELAAKLQVEGAVPLLREMTVPPHEGALTKGERRILIGAASALVAFQDCETLASYPEIVKTAADEIVRLRIMQTLYRATFGPAGSCKDRVPEEVVEAVVVGALDDEAQNPKHGALLILAQQPEWSKEITPRLLAILDGKDGDEVRVRRTAMEAIAKTGDETFARRLPRYFHDADPQIRSSAVTAAREYARIPDFPIRYESCWAGLVRDEVQNKVTFDNAVGGLRDSAGDWIGVPPKVLATEPRRPGYAAPPSVRQKVRTFREEMFEKGESAGISRLDWAQAWFDWWAKELGLSDEEVLEARKVRERFQEAQRAGDVAGAKKVLEDAPRRDEGLYTYEGGWLLARE